MKDTPAAEELLEAVAKTLTAQVLPETDGATAHAVRVAANLCRLVAREASTPGSAELDRALAEQLDLDPEDETDIAAALDDRLRRGDPDFDGQVADALYADVCRRVDIAKPGYRQVSE